MCGIAGFFGTGAETILRRMTDRIRHRGPDADAFLVEPDRGAYLGHRRLSILDISGGVQPLHTQDGALSIVIAALARVCAALEPTHSIPLLMVAGVAWAAAFLGFALAYAPLLCSARKF